MVKSDEAGKEKREKGRGRGERKRPDASLLSLKGGRDKKKKGQEVRPGSKKKEEKLEKKLAFR